MKSKALDFIDLKLVDIKKLLRDDDAYYINDIIVSSCMDPELINLAEDMLNSFGYESEIKNKILTIIADIQSRCEQDE